MGDLVQADWSEVERGVAKLLDGLDNGSGLLSRQHAAEAADSIRAQTPVLTGRLISTIDVVQDGEGYGVTYGGDLPYAWVIERQSHAVDSARAEAPDRFHRDGTDMAEKEVRRL